MFIRDAFIASLLGIFGYAGAAYANSCSNLDVIGTYDRSGLQENEYGIFAVGTFRIEKEENESKQPMFNLAFVNCEKQTDDANRVSLECTVTQAVVYAGSDKPNTDNQNCSLDLDVAKFSMKELSKEVLTGTEASTNTGCYNTILTIDRNTKRVYRTFTKTKYADNYDKIRPGTCGQLPVTQVLMNCTAWPRIRKGQKQTLVRYCDFSSSSAPYSTRYRKAKASKGLTGSFGDRSWPRKAII